MSPLGHSRRLQHQAATSAITLNADIRLHCNICRNGPLTEVSRCNKILVVLICVAAILQRVLPLAGINWF
jgi:hypothetical protein